MGSQEKPSHISEDTALVMERLRLTLMTDGRSDQEIADFEKRTAEAQGASRADGHKTGDPFLTGLEIVQQQHENDTGEGLRAACVKYIAEHLSGLYELSQEETFVEIMQCVDTYGPRAVRRTAAEMVREGRKGSIKKPLRVFRWRCSAHKSIQGRN